jgi:transcription-repair coupling factor (superfamily II helicase)
VLAFQHLNTFRARLAAFPVEVEMISRFRSRREIADVLARTAAGRVDILIGTHRLLSKDVVFQKLGLLVIDEEQRFGVRHKERLREIAAGVDTLALSATPIPRTLQMSLAGVRDISVVETPPRNRLAIQTHLLPYRSGVVAAAIRNELRRAGQVYVVHHRIDSIDALAAHLATLVPEARLAVAHGQMKESALERTMLTFMRGEADVLVSTTIIENGLDIPRVNTLLVTRADHYGLSQLYQMRGRIGRSDVQAYAYFLIPSRRTLTPVARRRLLALQEFSELGSGFRVAARDLEIRGAGELLGSRQHGHIAAIGFDLYTRMLERAVRELREGAAPPDEEGISINLGAEHRLPESYVPEPGLRLQLYHRLSVAESREEIEALRAELADRFGEPPPPARNLFRLAELRLLAVSLGAVSLDWADGAVAIRFGPRPGVDADHIVRLVGSDPEISLTPAGLLRARPPDAGADRIAAASMVLRRLAC